ncbi:MAG: hypothetical protein J0I77_23235 [Rudaea sp.]|uniref:hypothetical protein n=1 Tax=unclassified Rudaea TaxID=2627037 RepID=UPI0010FA4E24|nr:MULTISPECIES: hypothetical protein [unclassified Rudaea]MBN8888646.1 hypothetical protein [Rudaea sp.]MBR0345866.1 hypothetical protein [Rudaea sp.]
MSLLAESRDGCIARLGLPIKNLDRDTAAALLSAAQVALSRSATCTIGDYRSCKFPDHCTTNLALRHGGYLASNDKPFMEQHVMLIQFLLIAASLLLLLIAGAYVAIAVMLKMTRSRMMRAQLMQVARK